MKKLGFDVECYINYYLVMFKNPLTGKVRYYEKHNDDDSQSDLTRSQLKSLLSKFTQVGFNSLSYDRPMVRAAIGGMSNASLKRLSDQIIKNGDPHWITERKVDLPRFSFDHIDLIEPAPGVQVSLKIYGGRLGAPKLQDLPIEPNAIISKSDAAKLREYCVNDLDTTLLLLNAITPQIELREKLSAKYEVDLRSKSDAQIAESIFKQYLTAEDVTVAKRKTSVKPFKYRVPDWVEFSTPELSEALDRVESATFTVSDKGKPVMPKILDKYIEFDGAKYKFGIGGLHSNEKSQVVIPAPSQRFGEYDIASMYPSIILEQELFPLHLTDKFLKVYRSIYEERLKAKAEKNMLVANTYKILLNGSYGKFGSPYSFLYSPELLIQTTITGQLFLLMAIEKVTLSGGEVYSANTDGINVLCDNDKFQDIEAAIFECEMAAGYTFEYTPYSATYSRDVNNYVAIKGDGIKGKGFYGTGGLMKNPQTSVCMFAIHAYLKDNIPIETTIRDCDDITRFCVVRTVNGGAECNGVRLGKAIRWYYGKDSQNVITYIKNGNKVPKSDGSIPLMDLPANFPDDVDYQYYIDSTIGYLKDLGVNHA